MAKTPLYTNPMPYGNALQPEFAGLSGVPTGAQWQDPTAGLPLGPTTTQVAAPSGPEIMYSPSLRKFSVNGRVFDFDDEASAVESLNWMNEPAQGQRPEGGDWSNVRPEEYSNFVGQIVNPSMSRLASRNFGRGVDQLQSLAGAGAAFLGAEEFGRSVIEQQQEDLRRTSPYERLASDIGNDHRGVLDWFVANLAQQGPNIVESAVTAAAGFVAGSVAGGGVNPLTGVAGSIAGMTGKEAFKKSIVEAGKRYAKDMATPDDIAVLKKAAGLTGAAIATTGSNYAMGVSETFQEGMDQGNPSRGAAAIAGVPYALFESLPEFVLAGRVFGVGGLGGDLAKGSTGRIRSGLRAAGAGAVLEGATEVGQEATTMLATGQDITSDEALLRFFNAGAAGAAIGGGIGGLAGTIKPYDMLNDDTVDDPADTGQLAIEGPGNTPLLPAPAWDSIANEAGDLAYNNVFETETLRLPGMDLPVQNTPAQDFSALPPQQTSFPFNDTTAGTQLELPLAPNKPADVLRRGTANTNPAQGELPFEAGIPGQQLELFPGVPRQRTPASNVLARGATSDTSANGSAVSPAQGQLPLDTGLRPSLLEQAVKPPVNTQMADQLRVLQQQNSNRERAIENARKAGVPEEQLATIDYTQLEQQGQVDYADAVMLWDEYAAPKETSQPSVFFDDLTTAAQAQWMKAVKEGNTSEKLYKSLRMRKRPVPKQALKKDAPKKETKAEKTEESKKALKKAAPKKEEVAKPTGKKSLTKGRSQESASPKETPTNNQTVKEKSVEKVEDTKPQTEDKKVSVPAQAPQKSSGEEALEALKASKKRIPATITDTATSDALEELRDHQYIVNEFVALNTGDRNEAGTSLDAIVEIITGPSPSKAEASAKAEATSFFNDEFGTVFLEDESPDVMRARSALVRAFQAQLEQGSQRKASINYLASVEGMSDYLIANVDNRAPKVLRDYVESLKEGSVDLTQFDTRTSMTDLDTGRQLTPLAAGRTKMLVKSIVSKYKVKPNVSVFKDQADMKASNPALYAKAKRLSGAKDFDSDGVVAVAFGDKDVVIFSNRIQSQRHLRTVLAHESIGHFGFRSIVPMDKFKSVLKDIYEAGSEDMKFSVQYAQKTRNLPFHEAVEEYLADYAGAVDSSIINRFFTAIKNFLNRFGVEFADDTQRYWMSRARAYVRGLPNTFVNTRFGTDAYAFETGARRGELPARFSTDFSNLSRKVVYSQSGRYDADAEVQRLSSPFDRGLEYLMDFKNTGRKVMSSLRMTNYHARENEGFATVYKAVDDMSSMARQRVQAYQTMMGKALNRAVEIGGQNFGGGLSKDERAKVNRMLFITTSRGDYNLDKDPKLLDQYKSPITLDLETGNATIDPKAFEALKSAGKISVEEFRKGVKVPVRVARAPTKAEKDKWKQELAANLAKFPNQTQDHIKKRYDLQAEYDRKLLTPVFEEKGSYETIAAMPGLKEDDLVYEAYSKTFDTMAQANIDRALSTVAKGEASWALLFTRMKDMIGRTPTKEDKEFVKLIHDTFLKILNGGNKVAKSGVVNPTDESTASAYNFLASFNYGLIGKDSSNDRLMDTDTSGPFAKALQETYWGKNADIEGIRKQFIKFREGNKLRGASQDGDSRFALQTELANMIMTQRGRASEVQNATTNILTGYVPLVRRGNWQTRVIATDPKTGKRLEIHPSFAKELAYSQFETESEAKRMADMLGKEYADSKYEMLVGDGSGGWVFKEVVPSVTTSKVQKQQSVPTSGSIHDAIHMLNTFSINVRPEKMEQLIRAQTGAHDRIRKRFQRAGVIGSDPDNLRNATEFLEQAASHIARNTYMSDIDRALDPSSDELWYGSRDKWQQLKKRYETLRDNPQSGAAYANKLMTAKRAFDKYNFQYKTMDAPRRGNEYKDAANMLLSFIDGQASLAYSEFDMGDFGGRLRNLVSVSLLGGSAATGALNLIALPTNVIPALASYNNKRAFGGSFGMGRATKAIVQATRSTGHPSHNSAKFYTELLKKPSEMKRLGLSVDDVNYLIQFIGSGRGDAALFNSLLASTRGRAATGAGQKFIELYMLPFASTEMMSRRISGLAAFRLEMERTGDFKAAMEFSNEIVDNSIGQYANFGMPALFRGGVKQFLFMFKVFPVTAATLMRNMSWSGRLMMVATLVAMGGLKGIPLADDVMDLADTLAQRLLGMKVGSVEAAFIRSAEKAVPGLGRVLLDGFFDDALGATLSSRIQVGDIIPGTAIFLPGADTGREITNILGPAPAVAVEYLRLANNLGKYALETVGLKSDTTTLTKTLRESPVTMARALGDVIDYHNHGAIVNKNGYVVSDNLHLGVYISRMLGFYPSAAAEQFQIIKMSNRIGEYAKEVALEFRLEWIKAKAAGDIAWMRRVEQDVRDWNANAKGTGLEIPKFVQRAAKAYQQSRSLAVERSTKALAKGIRPQIEELVDILGL